MAVSTFNYTTGPAVLLDVGFLVYNGCEFSPLFISKMSGLVVKDNARRTTKMLEITLEVDGYVTLPSGDTSIDPVMQNLFTLLTAQGAELIYKGRGFDLHVNTPGTVIFNGAKSDVAWGPAPEVLDFQPLGGGLSAKIIWKVVVRIIQRTGGSAPLRTVRNPGQQVVQGPPPAPLLQFNCETTVTYGDDGYSTLSVKGTMEIPLTRTTQGNLTVQSTVDNYRNQLDYRIFAGIDLTRFAITQRSYNVSRDKRLMEFTVEAEEKPYIDLPVGCTEARGTFTVKPATSGMGLVNWFCTLDATYTVKGPLRPTGGDAVTPRQIAYAAFLALLRLRMAYSQLGDSQGVRGAPGGGSAPKGNNLRPFSPTIAANTNAAGYWQDFINTQSQANFPVSGRKAFLMDFSVREGLYRDSKTTSFSATWRLITKWEAIMQASGLWVKLPEKGANGQNLWATAMQNVSKSVSWLPNALDPSLDVIVDFGGA